MTRIAVSVLFLFFTTATMAAAIPVRPLILLEGGATFSAHYDLKYYDSTPRDTLFGVGRAGIRMGALSMYGEYGEKIAKHWARAFSVGLRLDLFKSGPSILGPFVEGLWYKNSPPVPPRENFSETSNALRYGIYSRAKIYGNFYSLLSLGFARISANFFVFPCLSLGVMF